MGRPEHTHDVPQLQDVLPQPFWSTWIEMICTVGFIARSARIKREGGLRTVFMVYSLGMMFWGDPTDDMAASYQALCFVLLTRLICSTLSPCLRRCGLI